MRTIILTLTLVATLAMLSSLTFGQGYILLNHDNPAGNSVTAFKVTATGTITSFKSLNTGGTGLSQGLLSMRQIAIESNAHCLFVADSGSSDIAAFEGPNFKQVTPNFTNSQLNGGLFGIALAVDSAGKFLYSAWSGSNNIGVLAIASDCSLSLVGSPISQPDIVADLAVAHNGQVLVVSYPNLGGAQAYTASAKGVLTALGSPLIFADAIAQCSTTACLPSGLDSTDDGQYWVWGNTAVSGASTLSATLTPKGFTNAALQSYSNSAVTNVETLWLSPAAAKSDAGNLYLAASGFGQGYPAGIIVANFNKGTITFDDSVVNASAFVAGGVQTIGISGTGSPLVQIATDISGNNTLYSYTVNGTTVTPANSLKVSGGAAFAIAAYPKRP
jgi:hypothetical protein